MKHTPGPWLAIGRESRYPDDDTDYELAVETDDAAACEIALVYTGGVASDQANADARLIAAAPDLLAACEAAFPLMEESVTPSDLSDRIHPDVARAHCLLRDAIAKARGETP